MPYNKKERIKFLKDIQKNSKDYLVNTGVRLKYKDGTQPFNVYKIPLDYLIYNQYNGRIGSLVKSYEEQYGILNPEKKEDIKIIEKFLYDSKPDRNVKTELNLVQFKQQRFGIVTSDGVIIDGNRRAMLIKRIFEKRNSTYKKEIVEWANHFEAVILPENATERDIIRLETIYQLGEDEKVDYNPIEKYLKIRDLLDNGFVIDDIARFMDEDSPKVKKWEGTMNLMDEYLDYLGYKHIYTRLDGREDQFLNLYDWIKRYKAGTAKIDWDYDTNTDISDLKSISFDYIRARFEGKEFRNIGNSSGKRPGAFFYEASWNRLKELHNKVEKINNSEKTIEEWQKKFPDLDKTDLLDKRDLDWSDTVEDILNDNLNKSQKIIERKIDNEAPNNLLMEAQDTLESIDLSSKSLRNRQNLKIIENINELIKKIKKAALKS